MMLRRNKVAVPRSRPLPRAFPKQKEANMPNSSKAPDEPPAAPPAAGEEGAGPSRGNSIEDASDEAVSFMEEGDEPGHAGRGDAG